MKKEATLLKNLRTYEVSLVDRGAIGEVFTVIKRAPDEDGFEEIRKELGEERFNEFEVEFEKSFNEHIGKETNVTKEEKTSIFKSAIKKAWDTMKADTPIKKDDGQKSTDFVSQFKSRMVRANLSNQFWELTDVLRDTIYNIVGSEETNKTEQIQNTLATFSEMVIGLTSNAIFTQSLTKRYVAEESIEKAGKKISSERLGKLKAAMSTIDDIIKEQEIETEDESIMKTEDLKAIEELVTKAFTPIVEKIAALEGKVNSVEKKEEKPAEVVEKKEDKPAEVVEKAEGKMDLNAISEVITKALNPLTEKLVVVEKRLEEVEKSEETSRKLKETGNEKKVEKSVSKWPSFSVGRN